VVSTWSGNRRSVHSAALFASCMRGLNRLREKPLLNEGHAF
jgi:hypothetical protein